MFKNLVRVLVAIGVTLLAMQATWMAIGPAPQWALWVAGFGAASLAGGFMGWLLFDAPRSDKSEVVDIQATVKDERTP